MTAGNSATFIGKVIERAKSSIAPNKYSKVVDWQRRSRAQRCGVMAKTRKLTTTAEIFEVYKKEKSVGPSHYQKTWIRPKTKGYSKLLEEKVTSMVSAGFEKKYIPAPNVYKGKGKDLFETLKEGSSTVHYGRRTDKLPNERMVRIKKDSTPGPTTFEVEKALQSSSFTKSIINQNFDKTKNLNFVDNILK